MRRQYVFDPREASGYVIALPEFLAFLFCRIFRRYDYWHNAEGN